MTTDPQPLKDTLNDLKQQLATLQELEPEQRGQLVAALAEIQMALRSKKSPGSESVMRRLGELTGHFETSHPTLATSIGTLINTLGNSGI